MDHRSEDTELVRSVGSPSIVEEIFEKNASPVNEGDAGDGEMESGADFLVQENEEDADLPQCKIKRNYSCNLCPFFSQNPRSFLYHSRDIHMDRIKIYECSQCLYASKHSQKLQRHINMIHVPGKTRKTRNRMVKPDRKGPRPIRPKPPDLSPEPSVKEFSLLTEEQKQKVDTENTDEPEKTTDGEYKCSACNFKHRNPKLLRRHEKVVHLKKRYLKCSKCSYMTHVTARFTKHVKYHSMPMIKCDLCDFRTPYKWNLDRHYKNHSGSGAFQCAKCNFRADIKQSLTVHEMNHHTPPVGQGAAAARKRNKVGGSDARASEKIKKEDVELCIEKEEVELVTGEEVEPGEDQNGEEVTNLQNIRNVKPPHSNKRESSNNSHLPTDFIHPDDVVPRYGQIFVKNLKCKFCSYKAVFSHEIWRHEKRIHGYVRPENKRENTPKRPPPQLIPIQNKNNSTAILKIPSVRNQSAIPSPDSTNQVQDKPVNEKEFSEMCKKSSLTSSLKDFVSLIGDEEGLKTIPDSSRDDLDTESSDQWASEPPDNSESKNDGEVNKQKQTDLLKKKNASFFDKLKEKLLTVYSEEQSLFCEVCGHESKCLSEAVAHQKRHSNSNYRSDSDGHPENDIVLSGAELSSTRCQHCRQRCKTSTDLINHLKSCKAFEASLDAFLNSENASKVKVKKEVSVDSDSEMKQENDSNGESMENRVFVWNDLGQIHNNDDEVQLNEEESLVTSPGYGTVTSKGTDNTESGTLVMEPDPSLHVIVKKVFKCPHCSFWASTASRFHVHIVGHLNKKPFECSLCFYRSNWRWDITKHIRLKSLRDPTHSQAKVNMTDETGRRNYSKYNRFLMMMRVQEPTAESSGYGRRSRCGDVTQGNAADKDILPLPAPPRLTRAPVVGASYQVPQGVPLRPPPPLKAAHQVQVQSKDSVKKTFWKCKKCNFRDIQKGRVLLHVKKHYMVKKNEKSSRSNTSSSSNEGSAGGGCGAEERDSNPESKPPLKTPSYICGHCHQVSNWKHVIQRHCKLKHNGNALIEVKWRGKILSQTHFSGENQEERTDDSAKSFSCDICPFSTDSEGDLTAHKLNHIDRPGSIFKCTYCPFYVPSKIAVLEHMEIHGPGGCDLSSLKVDNFESGEELIPLKYGNKKKMTKKYKCLQCPYISTSRTQFLYHKQFHRPRNSPFKCLYCTYNVSRRHLLHQHLRVHHNREGNPQKNEDQAKEVEKTSKEKRTAEESEEKQVDISDEDDMDVDKSDIPLVWVLKAGNIQKMYKCRFCPQVNSRKIKVLQHEKMHRKCTDDERNTANGNSRLKCCNCDYMCYNAAVLSSHMKVHQGFYGEIRSLVDLTRPESEQIEELKKSLGLTKPGIVVVEDALEHRDTQPLSSQPENAYNHKAEEGIDECKKMLSFCDKCPGRFFYKKELLIHSKFHMIHLPFRCSYCTYTARQRPHLLAHYKVHGQEYQKKTKGLVESYAVSPEHPRPKTIIITNESYVMEGPVWGVKPSKKNGKPEPKYACHRCPAKFLQTSALQCHVSLHGGNHKHKCKYCDYSTKTYGNLMKHEPVHEKKDKEVAKKAKFSYSFTISGTDLIQEEVDTQNGEEQKPEFVQPEESQEVNSQADLKKGKVKQKKYKCDKCPSAFEKRQQYEIHISLHGSQQKYCCEKCDYSVKYFANYTQHMRKHENHEKAVKLEDKTPQNENVKETYPSTLPDQQTSLLQKRKKSTEGREEDKKNFTCGYCPYYSTRRKAFEKHSWRHFLVSGLRSGFECPHCDYSTTQNNFLRKHIKFHFNSASQYKAEAYLKCEKMELWCCEEDAKDPRQILIFHDRGNEQPDRFFPPIVKFDSDQDDNNWKFKLNGKTENSSLEKEEFKPHSICKDDLIEMIEQVEEVEIKKRNRWKNWKCKKCPHAFGKRDQYLRHITLHGSNQRHKCDICDYSVKFYTNYVQHMRMHQMHEPDRVIHVKKNCESLFENSQRLLAESLSDGFDICASRNAESECGFESDESSQDNENLIIDESYEEKEEKSAGENLENRTVE